ncbi:universal stress protein [Methanolobus chelungpuianus]|uniref:Universal stress protein n=2 Tax=Methanolobus chelungpuianus TaxID=502115 RepID=A0AAE3HAS9_9EURY|nr:universal stress protein [Methanolobus chelungpuianus]
MCPGIRGMLITMGSSGRMKNIVECVRGLAKIYNAGISAIYVVSPSGIALAMHGEMWSKVLDSHLRDEGRKAIEYVVAAGEKEGVEVEPLIVEDKNPIDGIVDFAKQNDVDLIVMGTLGRTGLSHLLLGSVAEDIVMYSKRQVLNIP